VYGGRTWITEGIYGSLGWIEEDDHEMETIYLPPSELVQ